MTVSLGTVLLDDGAVVAPIERVHLEGGDIVVDIVLRRGVNYDGRTEKPYAVHDFTGRVVWLGMLGEIGAHDVNNPDDWHVHLHLTVNGSDRTTARYDRYQLERNQR